jgi:hypothetical protein
MTDRWGKPPLKHEFLPLPVGRLTLSTQQVQQLVTDLRCNVCQGIPEFEDFFETPCCSHVVCPECIKSVVSSKIGDQTRTRHRCPFCRYGDEMNETFSSRSLVRSSLKVALSAALFESPAEWNKDEMVDLKAAEKAHDKRAEKMKEDAAALRERMAAAAAAFASARLRWRRRRWHRPPRRPRPRAPP